MSARRPPPRRVAIVGSTASGKSAVALAAARAVGGVDIVSIDSMQVYRGMDIGTAKPTAAERSEVPHHLLDLVEPTHDFTVAEFQASYDVALRTVADEGRRALLVGGTGLYHRVVIDDFELPGEWSDVRADLEAVADTAALYERLGALDPAAAAKIEPGNRRRIVRALEVTVGSGRPFSSFGPGVDTYAPSAVDQIGLRWPRDVLTERIGRRVRAMLDGGFVAEVAGLRSRFGPDGLSRTAAQALGYREINAMLDGAIGDDEAYDLITTHTRQFAVRQERWFRRDPRVRWIDIEHDPVAEATPVVLTALDT